jgi:hypothetical protein
MNTQSAGGASPLVSTRGALLAGAPELAAALSALSECLDELEAVRIRLNDLGPEFAALRGSVILTQIIARKALENSQQEGSK